MNLKDKTLLITAARVKVCGRNEALARELFQRSSRFPPL
jgi:hypothetical protein